MDPFQEENFNEIPPEPSLLARAQHFFTKITQKLSHAHIRISPRARRILGTIGLSAATTVGVLVLIAAVGWQYRARILMAIIPQNPEPLAALTTPGAIPLTPTQSVASDLSVTDVVAKANKSVVSIEVYQTVPVYNQNTQSPFANLFPGFVFPGQQQVGTTEEKIGGGSGFFVTSDGLLVTNRHVVDFDSATFKVITSGGKTYTARVLAKDPVLDIALLRVSGSGFTPLTLGNSDSLQLGQSVVAIGYALGQFNNSISVGVISGLSRSIVAGDESGNSETLDKVIQTDAAINPGNSGGPLLNLRGEVIGVDVAVAQGSQNIGFALPINSVKQAINSVKNTGTIVRPYVGIRYVPVTATLQKQNNLPVSYGILVQRSSATELAVVPGSPADIAGIRENDIILSVDGVKLDDTTSFATLIRSKTVGERITLQIISGGVYKTISVTLGQAPTS